jgi:drug/metabolite transporter (DMT)-like permease
VNPVIAMVLGVAIAGEAVTSFEGMAAGVVLMGVVLMGVVLMLRGANASHSLSRRGRGLG